MLPAHVEFENARDHHHRLGTGTILQHRKAKGLGAVDKQSAAEALIVLHDPISAAVFSDLELQRPRARYY
jgi:hypothetical protein